MNPHLPDKNSQNLAHHHYDRVTRRHEKRKEEGFIRMELFVFIAIVVILLVLIGISRPTCTICYKGNQIKCLGNIKDIGFALKQYALDNNDTFPTGTTSTAVFASLTNKNYLSIGSVYVCPSSTNTFGSATHFTAANNSYSCVIGTESANAPLIFDTGLEGVMNGSPLLDANGKKWSPSSAHKGAGGNVLYVGGQATFKNKFELSANATNGYILNP